MTKISSISGITCSARNIDLTATLYNNLGFRLGTQEPDGLTVYVNWFWLRFQLADENQMQDTTQPTMSINIKVLDIQAFYQGVIAKGITPSGTPEETTWGTREFSVTDPDGHRLVFFEKN